MKIERTKNAARNIAFDGLQKTVNMMIPFIMRTVMLHYLGVKYLGLNGLFQSILSFLNLAELGVGSAMVFSMYEPIAKDDTDTICALMRLYRTSYRTIGIVIAVVGLTLTPFLRNLIKDEIPPDMNYCYRCDNMTSITRNPCTQIKKSERSQKDSGGIGSLLFG